MELVQLLTDPSTVRLEQTEKVHPTVLPTSDFFEMVEPATAKTEPAR